MKKIVSLFLVSLLVLGSCEDDLDINTNPNTPPQINKGLALSAAEGSIATVLGGTLFNLGGMWAQYYAQAPSAGQYDDIDQYNVDTEFGNRLWIELYAGALNDLEFVKEESTADEDPATFLIATVLQAYTFQYLVDIFGDVPYLEALQGNENITPAPTAGEEIYLDLISKIDAAMVAYEANPADSEVGAQDFIYEGNMDLWVQFANTLKLRMYLRMAYTTEANSSAVMDLMTENNFLTEDASFDVYSDATSKMNPIYEVQIEHLGNVNSVASNSLLEFYSRNEDPRIAAVYTLDNEGLYDGIDQGEGLSTELGGTLANQYSRPDIEPTHPVFFFTVAESKFLQAEASLRYGGGAMAQALYEEGVAASFALYSAVDGDETLALADPAAFTSGVYAYDPAADMETNLETIIVQKWAALANINHIEAWIETLRTGYPLLTDEEEPLYEEGRRIISEASILPGGQIPMSLFYPASEVQQNTNLDQKPDLLQPVWWNQR